MRVVSGKYKGRFLETSKFNARPTTDLAKESLFNILANSFNFEECHALDLFAGTGSISIEFASRGCKTVDLVESNRKHLALIKKNIQLLEVDQVRVIGGDVFRFLKNATRKYDIIFADPPYDLKGIESIPGLVKEREILNQDGWFILEHSKNYKFDHLDNFQHTRKYGSVHFSFFYFS